MSQQNSNPTQKTSPAAVIVPLGLLIGLIAGAILDEQTPLQKPRH